MLNNNNKNTEAENKTKELESLLNAARIVLEGSDFETTARGIFDAAREMTGAKSGYVALLSESGEENELLFLEAGGLPCDVDPELPMPVRGLRAESYHSGEVVSENDFMNSPWIKYMPEGHVELKNVMFAPLNIDRKTVGIMGLANKDSDFTENDKNMAAAYGQLAAIALKNSRTFEELQNFRSKLETAMTAGSISWWEMDIETGEVAFDEKKALMLGYRPEDFSHYTDFTDLLHLDDHDKAMDAMRNHLEGKAQRYDVEYRIKTKSGGYKCFHDVGGVVEWDADGKPLKATGIVIDITLRKETEKALIESEMMFKNLAENTSDLIILHDYDGSFLYISPQIEKFTGYSASEYLDLNTYDNIYPEDREKVIKEMKKLYEGADSGIVQYRIFKKNGDLIWLETRSNVIRDRNGQIKNLISASSDISEAKIAEEYSRHLNRVLKAIKEINKLIIEETDVAALIGRACEITVKNSGYPMAAFGVYDKERKIERYAASGEDRAAQTFKDSDCQPKLFPLCWQKINDSEKEELVEYSGGDLCKECSIKNSYFSRCKSVIIAKLRFRDEVLGIMAVAVPEVFYEKEAEREVLRELKNDVGFALHHINVLKEKKQTLKRLKESEKKYRLIADNSIDVIWQMNTSLVFTYVSPSIKAMTGYKPEEWVGSKLSDHASFKEFFNMAKRAILALKNYKKFNQVVFEARMLRKDGSEFPVEISSKLIFNEKGFPTGLQGTTRDITERYKAEADLKDSESKYRNLVENSLAGIYKSNLNGEILFANQAFADLLEFPSAQALLHRNAYEFYPDSNDRDMLMNQAKKEKTVKNYEIRLLTGKGNLKDVVLNVLMEGSTITGIVFDITKLKQAEDALRKSEKLSQKIINSMADGFSILDNNGVHLDVNPALCGMTGFSFEELIGSTPPHPYYPEEEYDNINEAFTKSLSSETSDYELIFKKKSGERFPVLVSPAQIKDDNGKIQYLFATVKDITDIKNVQMNLLKAKNEAESMNRIKTSFLANMSHEMRTPMVGILGFAEILSKELQNNELKEMADIIMLSGKRLMETLGKVLDFSKIEFNKQVVHRTHINITSTVVNSAELYRQAAANKDLYLKLDVKEDSLKGNLDESLLSKIMDNLLNNAVKYTGKGGITVVIDKMIEGKNVFAVINVKDTGIGIPEENRDIIFKDFRQGSEGINRNFEGTGLGLTIAKHYIELMDGVISVESEHGKGTVFTVKLPAKSDNLDIEHKPENKMNKTDDSKTSEMKLLKCLVVEDDAPSRILIEKCIKHLCNLEYAPNAEKALNMVKNKKYDFILMDINLGKGKDGIEATREIREMEEYKNTPIVALTAFAMDDDKEEFLKNGCTHYLSKPFKKLEIVQLVESII